MSDSAVERNDLSEIELDHPLREPIYDALRQIVDPCSAATSTPMNLVEMGLIDRVEINGSSSRVDVHLRLTSPQCMMIAYMTTAAKNLITELPGIEQVEVHADHGLDWSPAMIHPEAQERRRSQLRIISTRSGGSPRRTEGCGSSLLAAK